MRNMIEQQLDSTLDSLRGKLNLDNFDNSFAALKLLAQSVSFSVGAARGLGRKLPALEPDDHPGLTMVVGGEATAVGDETRAKGEIRAEIDSAGRAVVAFAQMDWVARAEDAESAFAATEQFFEIDGADAILFIEVQRSTDDTDANTGYSASRSKMLVAAIDWLDFDFARGPIVNGVEIDREGVMRDRFVSGGNKARFEGEFRVFGDDTLATLDAEAISIEASLSSVAAIGLGSSVTLMA